MTRKDAAYRDLVKIFKSWQVCDLLAKWTTTLRFMDLRWPRVFWRSNVGLVSYSWPSFGAPSFLSPPIGDKLWICCCSLFLFFPWTTLLFCCLLCASQLFFSPFICHSSMPSSCFGFLGVFCPLCGYVVACFEPFHPLACAIHHSVFH